MKRLLWVALLLLAGSGLKAQDYKLVVDADLLTRGELRIGGLATEDDDIADNASFILERSRLGISYERPSLQTKLTAQHATTWGSAQNVSFNVYEAWAKLFTKSGLFAQFGRQNLSYDDQRIFGSDEWSMTGLSHDALKLGYEGHGHKVHLVGAYNQNLANMSGGTYFTGGLQPYKSMAALWYHYDVPNTGLGASLLFMNAGMQGKDNNEVEHTFYQQIAGVYVSYCPKKWSAEAAYYHQMGKDETGIPIDAWMASAKFAFNPGEHWSVYGGYDFLSGDHSFATPPKGSIGLTRHETIRGFSSLYGSHNKFYGAMDFFYVTTYVNGFTPGLQNAYVGGKWMPGKKVAVDASYHFLATATKLYNAKMPLGHEVELKASYKFFNDCSISAGYSFMKGTDTMVVLKRASSQGDLHWAWLMLIINPTIFSKVW